MTRQPGPRDLSPRGQALILAAAAAYPSFSTWSNNPLEFPHPFRLILITTAIWAVTFGMMQLASRFGATRWGATAGGVVWALTLGQGGVLAARVGVLATMAGGLALGALITILVTRLHSRLAVEAPVLVLACILGIGPVGSLATDMFEQRSEVELNSPESMIATSLTERPDIYLVVVDGFAGIEGAKQVFGEERPVWVEALGDRGFEIPESGWASYPVTIASIPSLFDMDYPIEAGVLGERATISALIGKLGGANRLVSTLNRNGYRTVMVEAGWSWSHCGPEYDECVPSAFYDEGTFAVASRGILGPSLNRRVAHPFTVGALHAMDSLLQLTEDTAGSEPRFVFGHIMAPHPPFFLDSDCDVAYTRDRSGGRLDNGLTEISQRKALYLEQASCITNFMVEFSDSTKPGDVVIFASDHGSDSHDQLLKSASDWTLDDSVERLSALVALRAPGCHLQGPVLIPNLMRVVLDCLGGNTSASAVPLEERMFKGTLRLDGGPSHLDELSPFEVDSVISAGFGSAG